MELEALQAQAGHRSIETTRLYIHLANGWLAEEYDRASAVIDAEIPGWKDLAPEACRLASFTTPKDLV